MVNLLSTIPSTGSKSSYTISTPAERSNSMNILEQITDIRERLLVGDNLFTHDDVTIVLQVLDLVVSMIPVPANTEQIAENQKKLGAAIALDLRNHGIRSPIDKIDLYWLAINTGKSSTLNKALVLEYIRNEIRLGNTP